MYDWFRLYNLSHHKISLSHNAGTNQLGMRRPRNTSSKGTIVQLAHRPKGRIVQGADHPRLFVQGRTRQGQNIITLYYLILCLRRHLFYLENGRLYLFKEVLRREIQGLKMYPVYR
jgi:hypothetical protein